MKEQERKEIIECLEFVANQFEADRTRTKELIEAMKKINCETEFTHLQQIKLKQLVDTCCDLLDYDNDTANNASRDVVNVEKRRAIYYFAYVINNHNPRVFYGLAKAFGKHRTSFNFHVEKARELIDCKDEFFLSYYNRLLTHTFDTDK